MAESTRKARIRVKPEEFAKKFKVDCKDLLVFFSGIEEASYKEFVYLWIDRGMTLCSVLHRSLAKITFYNEYYFEVAKELLFVDDEDYSKIGALYLLYTLFSRQYARCKTLIGLNIHECKLYTDIVSKLYEEGHIDAKIIHKILIEKNAFEFIICNENETEVKKAKKKNVEIKELDKEILELFNSAAQSYKKSLEFITNAETGLPPNSFISLKDLDQHLKEINLFFTGSKSEIFKSKMFNEDKGNVQNKLLELRSALKEKAMTFSKSDSKHLLSEIPAGPSGNLKVNKKVDKKPHSKKGYKRAIGACVESDDEADTSDDEFSDLHSSKLDLPNF